MVKCYGINLAVNFTNDCRFSKKMGQKGIDALKRDKECKEYSAYIDCYWQILEKFQKFDFLLGFFCICKIFFPQNL